MSTLDLPPAVETLAGQLAGLPGAVAVVLGGSRATGEAGPDSDWDLGLYYRSSTGFDPDALRALGYEGYVSALGEWGPIVHGGAWLRVDGRKVDVLFRDLDTVDRWHEQARRGEFEVLEQAGHVAGAPTYLPVGELAMCLPVHGQVPRPGFPDALATAAPRYWLGHAEVCLMFAEGHAGLGDSVCCAGMLADAVLSTAHARLAGRREWVLNEKRLLDKAGLGDLREYLARPGGSAAELAATVAAVRQVLRD